MWCAVHCESCAIHDSVFGEAVSGQFGVYSNCTGALDAMVEVSATLTQRCQQTRTHPKNAVVAGVLAVKKV